MCPLFKVLPTRTELDVALGNRSGGAVLLDFSVFVVLAHSSKCSLTVRRVDVKRREGIQWEHRDH